MKDSIGYLLSQNSSKIFKILQKISSTKKDNIRCNEIKLNRILLKSNRVNQNKLSFFVDDIF